MEDEVRPPGVARPGVGAGVPRPTVPSPVADGTSPRPTAASEAAHPVAPGTSRPPVRRQVLPATVAVPARTTMGDVLRVPGVGLTTCVAEARPAYRPTEAVAGTDVRVAMAGAEILVLRRTPLVGVGRRPVLPKPSQAKAATPSEVVGEAVGARLLVEGLEVEVHLPGVVRKEGPNVTPRLRRRVHGLVQRPANVTEDEVTISPRVTAAGLDVRGASVVDVLGPTAYP